MIKFLISTEILIFPFVLFAQQKSWDLKGYLSDLQMVHMQKVDTSWFFDNELNNRLDFSWYPGNVFSLGIGIRNRFLFRQTLTGYTEYRGSVINDNGLINMTWSLLEGKSCLLVTQFDRAWVSLSEGILQFTIGRQRINWGQTIVWNPNDIFNTYSYFDFDYPERPGSDAMRLQVFPSETSAVELAAKWNSEGEMTLAGLYRFNVRCYDVQVLGGMVDSHDFMIGAGWAGNIWKAAFRGEVSYFYPTRSFSDTSGMILATTGVDCTFGNSLSLLFQVLYNQLPSGYHPENFLSVYQAPTSVKALSFTEWNLFMQGSWQISPLFSATLAGMYFPQLCGFYLGPNCNYSINQDIDLSLFIQYFQGEYSQTGQVTDQYLPFKSALAALRLKWCF
jgi:hypothetical protein